jgi:acyl-CoA thioesterase
MDASDADELASRVAKALFERDAASRGLGIEIEEVRAGYVKLSMLVRPEMLNGHDVCHGGFIFAMADSAFAFCCNSFNNNTLASGVTIDFLAPARRGDRLTAVATPIWRSRRIGLFEIVVTKQDGTQIAAFRGRSYQIAGNVVQP